MVKMANGGLILFQRPHPQEEQGLQPMDARQSHQTSMFEFFIGTWLGTWLGTGKNIDSASSAPKVQFAHYMIFGTPEL